MKKIIPLKDEIKNAVAAAFSGIWINSYEQEEAMRAVAEACKEHGWTLMTWDPEFQLREADKEPEPAPLGTPISPIPAMLKLLATKPTDEHGSVILVLRNSLPYFVHADGRVGDGLTLQVLQRTIEMGSESGHFVVILGYDHLKIPAELEKMVYLIDHNLPDAEELYALMQSVENEDNLPELKSTEGQTLVNAAAGLTRLEAQGAYALSYAKHAKIRPDELWDLKSKTLKKGGLLEMLSRQDQESSDTPVGFKSLGGLNALKEFSLQMFNSPFRDDNVRPLGLTLVGPPGTGKSMFAGSLGDEVGRPTVRLDVGRLMGGIIGETESNTRRAFKTIDAMAPLVLMLDEIEKALAGTGGGGSNDSGVGARLLGSILTWLNDHTSDVFPIFTANSIDNLPPELFRAERIDGIFFVDMPDAEQRGICWDLYTSRYKLSREQIAKRPDDDNWTPAEIKSCCRQARLRGLTLAQAAETVVPVYKTKKESIENLRLWATDRCLSANYRGIYSMNGPKKMLSAEEMESALATLATRGRRRVLAGK